MARSTRQMAYASGSSIRDFNVILITGRSHTLSNQSAGWLNQSIRCIPPKVAGVRSNMARETALDNSWLYWTSKSPWCSLCGSSTSTTGTQNGTVCIPGRGPKLCLVNAPTKFH